MENTDRKIHAHCSARIMLYIFRYSRETTSLFFCHSDFSGDDRFSPRPREISLREDGVVCLGLPLTSFLLIDPQELRFCQKFAIDNTSKTHKLWMVSGWGVV